MNYKDALNLTEYQHQKLVAEFGDAVYLSWYKDLDFEHIKSLTLQLAENLGHFIAQRGYRPSDKSKVIIKVPGNLPSSDPLNTHATIGGTNEGDLSATRNQYVLYASDVIDELKSECKRQIEYTWKDRLGKLLDSMFDKKYPHYEGDVEQRFEQKKGELLTQIENMVTAFEIPEV